MKEIYYIKKLEVLKILSDPIRVKIITTLSTSPKNSQYVADKLGLARTKVLYHLNILEKNNLIEVAQTDMINGIVQKYYIPVAKAFIPDPNIFHKFLSDENEIVKVKKEDQKNFLREFRKLKEKYETKDEQASIYNLFQIG